MAKLTKNKKLALEKLDTAKQIYALTEAASLVKEITKLNSMLL
jgi:hypothetical protein